MVDRLATLLERFAVNASVFHAGALCGINSLPGEDEAGQLHLVRRGPVQVSHGQQTVQVDVPSLLLYPRPMPHRFSTDPQHGADMACANLHFEGGRLNPISAALPDFICMPLTDLQGGSAALDLLFEEAFEQRCGRTVMVNRLFEVVMIQVLRQLMEAGQMRGGLFAGLGHPRLRLALVAVHEAPAQAWTLEDLAETAGMSRSVFAASFREAMGITPGQYLQGWRVSLAQQALRQGRPLKRIADDVGYGSEAALSRAFKAHTGQSPRQWREQDRASAA